MNVATVAMVVFGLPITVAAPSPQDSESITAGTKLASITAVQYTTAVTPSVSDFESETTTALETFDSSPIQATPAI